jgi:hypothetical protein
MTLDTYALRGEGQKTAAVSASKVRKWAVSTWTDLLLLHNKYAGNTCGHAEAESMFMASCRPRVEYRT